MRIVYLIAMVSVLFPYGHSLAQDEDGVYIIDQKNGCNIWNWQPQGNESVTWTGKCLDGFGEGKGRLTWYENGVEKNHYDGFLRHGRRNGKGVNVYSDGAHYEGDWVDGKRHGKGVLINGDGSRYEGDFYKHKRHGKGTYTWPNSNSNCGHKFCSKKYVGEWKGGKMTFGTLDFFNGDRYVGSFNSDEEMAGKTDRQAAEYASSSSRRRQEEPHATSQKQNRKLSCNVERTSVPSTGTPYVVMCTDNNDVVPYIMGSYSIYNDGTITTGCTRGPSTVLWPHQGVSGAQWVIDNCNYRQ
jgi:hypothetical protein